PPMSPFTLSIASLLLSLCDSLHTPSCYTLSLHDALPIYLHATETNHAEEVLDVVLPANHEPPKMMQPGEKSFDSPTSAVATQRADRKSTRLNSSHGSISYAVFCLKKKKRI